MQKFNLLLFFILTFNIFSNEELFNEYSNLYNDLINFDTMGYKSSWNIENHRGGNKINISQGSLMATNNLEDFAIIGEGFFKIKLENDIIGYTRSGELNMVFDDSDSELTLVTRHGCKLYDPIIIPAATVNLSLEDNTLFALLYDGTKFEAGKINVYEVDDSILIRYKDNFWPKNNIFITSDNFNSQIINDSRIARRLLETSNVSVTETLMRMHIILNELKRYGYNFDERDQLILMLINNVPILNELTAIQSELQNNNEKIKTDNELTEEEGRTVIINGEEVKLPFLLPKRGLTIRIPRTYLQYSGYELLRSSFGFLRID